MLTDHLIGVIRRYKLENNRSPGAVLLNYVYKARLFREMDDAATFYDRRFNRVAIHNVPIWFTDDVDEQSVWVAEAAPIFAELPSMVDGDQKTR